MRQFLHCNLEIAVALFLSTRLQTLLVILIARKVSTLMVQPTEHVRIIINGMVLWPNVKVI